MITRHLSDSQLIAACQPIPDNQAHPGHGYLDHVVLLSVPPDPA